MKFSKVIGLTGAMIFMVGCSFLNSPERKNVHIVPKRALGDLVQKAPKNVNWEGYYHGKLPCYNCVGVDTWLKLSIKDGRCVYDLREKYLGKKNVTSKGGISWLRDGAEAKLLDSEDKYLFLSNGTVTFIRSPQSSIDDSYTLEKYDVFKNENVSFLINPQSIQAGKMGGKSAIKFSGITNYEMPTPSGYKSLRSTYLLKCQEGKFKMSRIAYYNKKFTMGNFVYPQENISGKWFDVGNIELMNQVRDRYCYR